MEPQVGSLSLNQDTAGRHRPALLADRRDPRTGAGPKRGKPRLRSLIESRLDRVGLSAGRLLVEWIGSVRRNVLRGLAHDLDDLRHDITAATAGGAHEQIAHRGLIFLHLRRRQIPNRLDLILCMKCQAELEPQTRAGMWG
jgi:hypothetical protein